MPRPRKDPSDPKWATAPTAPDRERTYPSRAKAVPPKPLLDALGDDDFTDPAPQERQAPKPAPLPDLAAADLARYDALLLAEEALKNAGTVIVQIAARDRVWAVRAEMSATGQMDRAAVRQLAREAKAAG